MRELKSKYFFSEFAFSFFLAFFLIATLTSCSNSSKNTTDTPEAWSPLKHKRLAIEEIEGPESAQKIVEVAFVNEVHKRGSFVLLSKKEIAQARNRDEKPASDLTLKIKITSFDTEDIDSYAPDTEEDSVLVEERGSGDNNKRNIHSVERTGKIRVELAFFDAQGSLIKQGIVEKTDSVTKSDKSGAIHFSPKLYFLDSITRKAMADFFVQNQL